ncbi:RagB/SusD family nutrient uptake outer membrane protein [Wenyingzhuangia sp. chi5]|uniref:RagB/SusD family nutrient uptake outer membrane protein n=1 Tax=Wenyingzhuangia gilva TaxID=3057677 RepID=A0ABT8VQ40_9FLAO|nr:RagB/SusD family nutrient uptake outer membrane protein [Wenyingzhuangia sp. chi5]MDO3694089.1 RagB/SusD family nutrient uptake outer membrane protein [Wenyingzhuangia sp. chi5]
MNRNIFKITSVLLIMLVGLSVASCSEEFTDFQPQGNTSSGNFWKTQEDAEKAANGLYFYMKDEDMFSRGFMWYINASDDIITGRIKGFADNTKNFILDGNEDGLKWMYPQSFKIIRRANDILANVPNMNFDEATKNRIIGEAYFMRAFHYHLLAYHYGDDKSGGIPIITEENMNATAGSFKRPASVVDNYKQIVEDLQKAADLLPLITKYNDADKGRANKDAALAYMAKTYLYWAQFDATKYADAVKACDAVTNSGSGRALFTVGNNNPKEDYRKLHSHLSNWSSEYIWSVNSGVQSGSKLPGVMLENKGWGAYNGWGYYQPTEELYQEFEDGDPRREVTILKFGDEFPYFGETKKYQSSNSLSGFQFNKYMYEYGEKDAIGVDLNSNGDDPSTTYNVPLLRYAEILLIKAEALIMQGKNGDVPLNLVRARVGLAPKTNATMEDLKHERRVELAAEFADRHFDLVRWGDAKEVYSKPLHGRIHEDASNPDSPYKVEEVWPARNFDPSYMNVWIIPQGVINSSGIPQNKGWD